MLNPDGVGVSGENIRQALVHLRRLVRSAADEHDALLSDAGLHSRPVDETRLQLLLDPHFLDACLRMIGAGLVRLEDAVAVAVTAHPALSAPDPARSLRTAHHAAGAVDGGEEGFLVLVRLDALQDDGVVTHGAADEPLLARAGGRAALPDHPVRAAEVLLPPREVVVV